jgi:hypothetical protein
MRNRRIDTRGKNLERLEPLELLERVVYLTAHGEPVEPLDQIQFKLRWNRGYAPAYDTPDRAEKWPWSFRRQGDRRNRGHSYGAGNRERRRKCRGRADIRFADYRRKSTRGVEESKKAKSKKKRGGGKENIKKPDSAIFQAPNKEVEKEMLSAQENDFVTRTGPGTPMGELMRRFWMPILLPEELPSPDGAPVRVRLHRCVRCVGRIYQQARTTVKESSRRRKGRLRGG